MKASLTPYDRAMSFLEAAFKNIGHGHEFHRAVFDRQGICRSTAAAPTTTDKRNLNGVIVRRVDVRQGDAGER